ncbi:hypothetical protein ACIQWA_22220 [Kitasatospora sp. NPDC098652]|uniref:hypothetical protein n=1 Tax=Kitasatospora sp. NPDC098652 TaxID=3364095 RepID=UPI00382BB718
MSHKATANRFLPPMAAAFVAALTAGAVIATASGAHAETFQQKRALATVVAERADPVPDDVPTKLSELTEEESDQLSAAVYEPYLTQLEAVPDEVIDQGGEAVITRVTEQIATASGPRPGDTQAVQAGWFDIKCIGLVLAAAGGALIPASKVLKVAKIVKKYGVRRVVNAIKGVRKGKGATVGAELKDVALILLGLDKVQEACS